MTGDDGVARTGAGGLPTLEAVASAAGVSRATVSRVINGDQRVAADRRAAVEAAVLRLGYTPNRAARSLVTRRSESLAFVVEEDDDTVFSDPFFGRMARSISEALAEREMQLVLMTARDEGSRARVRRYVLGGHVDGTLLVSTHGRSTFAAGLRAAGVPVVVAGRPSGGVELTYVDADNLGGARAAVTLLAERGCRRIARSRGRSTCPRARTASAAMSRRSRRRGSRLTRRSSCTETSPRRAERRRCASCSIAGRGSTASSPPRT